MSYTLAYTGAEIDALLGKIDAIFVAEYGSTIYSEVTAAIAAGNKVIVANAGKVFVYAGTDDNSGYVFTQSGPNAAKPNATYVTLSTGNVWSTATVDLATVQQFYASLMEDTASGSIASFPDGAENVPVKELTAEIEPIQDLHGQASPYPEGGGKNKAPWTITALKNTSSQPSGSSWSGNTYSHNGVAWTFETLEDGDTITKVIANGTAGAQSLLKLGAAYNAGSYIATALATAGSYTTFHASYNGTNITTTAGASVSIPTDGTNASFFLYINAGYTANNVVFYPMIRLSTEADATFAPYSNECPISGYTGAEITVANKNLVLSSVANCGVNETGTIYATQAYKLFVAPVKEGETYTITTKDNTAVVYAFFNSVPTIGSISYNGSRVVYFSSQTTATLTAPMTGYIAFRSDSDFVNAQLELGSSVTQYEAPSTTIYSVSWSDEAGTVYKGTAQYKGGGEWEITSLAAIIDMGTPAWVMVADNNHIFYADLAGKANGRTNLISSAYQTNAAIGMLLPDGCIRGEDNSNRTYVRNTAYASAADFKTAMAGQTILYDLATPVTFTVTGPTPETLLGDNNMWSDTGDISVKYRANTALYIEKKLGE